jgi:hypothetical protein
LSCCIHCHAYVKNGREMISMRIPSVLGY